MASSYINARANYRNIHAKYIRKRGNREHQQSYFLLMKQDQSHDHITSKTPLKTNTSFSKERKKTSGDYLQRKPSFLSPRRNCFLIKSEKTPPTPKLLNTYLPTKKTRSLLPCEHKEATVFAFSFSFFFGSLFFSFRLLSSLFKKGKSFIVLVIPQRVS